jgi:hypothetical protein
MARARFSAFMLVLSLSPPEALAFLSGIHTTLIVWHRIPTLLLGLEVSDRLVIHTLGFPDAPLERQLCQEILQEFGFDVQTFPAWAIQGLATIEEVFLYDGDRFAQDAEVHGCGADLFEYQHSQAQDQALCYGIRLSDTFFLDEPIYDVLPPLESDRFWIPQTPFQIDAFRWALQRDQA